MESMTGYAFIEKNCDQFTFSIEIKSLNSRYLETFINIPKIIRTEENEIQKLIKKNFNRGKIEINIDIYDWNVSRPVSLNEDLIIKYFKKLKSIQNKLKIKEPLSLEAILRLDGVSQRERTGLSQKSKNDIYKTINIAIKKTREMRLKEGSATREDILKSIRIITEKTTEIKSLSKNVVKTKMNEIKDRIEKISRNNIDEVRLYSEIAILADKLDVNEEIVRLKDHVKKFREISSKGKQVGRKLDFLAQEMFREINTIASKSNSSDVSHIVVDVKNHIDKIREQCRNIV